MAKHMIYPAADGPGADRRIELRWQRDGFVQLATVGWHGTGEPDRGADYLPPVTGSSDPLLAWGGEYVDLSRADVNHLIKQLRVARDQAFGRDE